jgi:hypothetical protein
MKEYLTQIKIITNAEVVLCTNIKLKGVEVRLQLDT